MTSPPGDPSPRVACVGGGHGLSATLAAVRPWAGEVTAVVSVADDGGSSGRLRDDLGIPPPGDLRRCLSALADPGSTLGRALEHRFGAGELKEHAVGNVLLAGLVDAGVALEDALDEVGRAVGAVGRVLPAASVAVTLTGVRGSAADGSPAGDGDAVAAGEAIEGQVEVQQASGVRHVAIRPADPPTSPAVGEALAGADLVVLGPGSLFTSVLAAAVVPGVARSLARTAATRVLVLNLGPQAGETEGLSPDDHVRLALEHAVPVDVVLADPRFAPTTEAVPVHVAEVGSPTAPLHDPGRLGTALAALVGSRGGA